MKKLYTVVAAIALIAAGLYLFPSHESLAQNTGLVTLPGQINAVNQFQPSTSAGVAGAVTNPASSFVIQVAGGAVYFNGSVQTIGQVQLTLPASSTNLVVWNGTTEAIYAKQAVTGPGSSGTSVGIPAAVLFAIPGQEVALATVVCNATACGNGGNGSITDARALANFPAGTYISGHVNQAAAGTGAAGSAAGTCTAAAATTCVVTFSQAFQVAPACFVTDQTTTANGALKALPTTTNLTITTASSSDVFSYFCIGNPN